MKTLNTLHRSSTMFAFAVLAAASLGAQQGPAGAKAQAGAVNAPGVTAPNHGEEPAFGKGAKLIVKPEPTFEGDLVRVDPLPPGGKLTSGLRVAMPSAPVVSWSVAPSQITLQSGESALFEISHARPHLVRWVGATEIELGNLHSIAEFRAEAAGVHLVQAALTSPDGTSLGVASVVIEVAGALEPSAGVGGLGPIIGLPTGSCRMSIVQVVPGITNTFIAVVKACNAGTTATSLKFELEMSSPAGKTWDAITPAGTAVLASAECTTVYVAFTLLDTDASASSPDAGRATLTLHAFTKQGVLGAFQGLLGGASSPTCSLELMEVDFGNIGN